MLRLLNTKDWIKLRISEDNNELFVVYDKGIYFFEQEEHEFQSPKHFCFIRLPKEL